jgi:hypothetical protein
MKKPYAYRFAVRSSCGDHLRNCPYLKALVKTTKLAARAIEELEAAA